MWKCCQRLYFRKHNPTLKFIVAYWHSLPEKVILFFCPSKITWLCPSDPTQICVSTANKSVRVKPRVGVTVKNWWAIYLDSEDARLSPQSDIRFFSNWNYLDQIKSKYTNIDEYIKYVEEDLLLSLNQNYCGTPRTRSHVNKTT